MSLKDSPDIISLSQANNHLAVNMYKILVKSENNIFFSPFSLSTALAMLFCGTESETSAEMRCTLGYEVARIKDDDLKSCFQCILSDLEKNPDFYTLSCANSMVSHKDFDIKDNYKSLLKECFKALLKQVDFIHESQKAVQEINEWVKEKTQGKISDLINNLDPSTVIVLLNAVYFKGSWLHQFKERDTFLQYFYNQGDKNNYKQVDMMHLKKSFPFVEKETFKALELPYKGNEISMLILLPNAKDGLVELESQLSSSFIQEIKKDMYSQKVEVALPKFCMEYSKALSQCFQSLGMKRVFKPGSHFGPISDCKELYVSEIIHKAVLEVNEEGTVAAAATAVMMMACSLPPPTPEFIVDHPFSFVIYNVKNNLVLFMGRVNEL